MRLMEGAVHGRVAAQGLARLPRRKPPWGVVVTVSWRAAAERERARGGCVDGRLQDPPEPDYSVVDEEEEGALLALFTARPGLGWGPL